MNLNWKKTIVFGIIIWVVIFVFITIMIAFGLREETFFRWLITQIVGIVTGVILAKKLTLSKIQQALSTGLVWVIIALILDLLITVRFTTMAFFNSWMIWVSYFIILLVPVVVLKKNFGISKTPPAPSL